jgi:hypothetical protein
MKTKAVKKPSFDTIFKNAIASAMIEGINFDHKTLARIKKQAAKTLETGSR